LVAFVHGVVDDWVCAARVKWSVTQMRVSQESRVVATMHHDAVSSVNHDDTIAQLAPRPPLAETMGHDNMHECLLRVHRMVIEAHDEMAAGVLLTSSHTRRLMTR
jgi:hypothetical protein